MENELIVEIEELSNLGSGVAKVDGMVIFVENACPKDKLKVRITKKTKSYANAEIIEIVEPSPYRVKPFCPMQKVCGSCQMQFIDYNYQLEIKKQIVQNSMRKLDNVTVGDVIASPKTKEYRHKVQYPISQTRDSKRILAGYYKPKSHEIVNIKYCPIQPEICDKIMEFIRNTAFDFAITGFNEKKHKGDLRHVVLRISKATGKVLVTLVVNSTKMFDGIKDFGQNIYDNFKEVTGVCVNYNPKRTNIILGEKTELIAGKEFIKEHVSDKTFRIGSNTFFQVNPKSAENIFNFVREEIKKSFEEPSILDAYAGVTTFGIIASDIAKKVVSVEMCKEAVDFADETIKLNEIKNIELHNMDTAKFMEKEIKTKKRKFDVIILEIGRAHV